MNQKVTQAEFARVIGVSRQRVAELVREGKIELDENKKIDRDKALVKWEMIKAVGYGGRGDATKRKFAKAAKATQAEIEKIGDDPTLIDLQYNKSRAEKMTYDAKIKELEMLELEKILVPIDDVKLDAAKLGAAIKEILYSIPNRVAPNCFGRSVLEIEIEIEAEITAALEKLKDGEFM